MRFSLQSIHGHMRVAFLPECFGRDYVGGGHVCRGDLEDGGQIVAVAAYLSK